MAGRLGTRPDLRFYCFSRFSSASTRAISSWVTHGVPAAATLHFSTSLVADADQPLAACTTADLNA
jgi:hypothetical protein